MSIEPLLRCAVSYQTPSGTQGANEVLLRGSTPQARWAKAARMALTRQHGVTAARITNIRICLTETPPARPVACAPALMEAVQ